MHKPTVYLIGAGPGDPGLLTLRGRDCLSQADFVLYDYLLSERILQYAKPGAELLCVRDLADCHPDRWPQIHVKLIEEARKGKVVARLKGGDPMIFGRGGEEAEALREAGVAYEIVPGVTAALAAGSYLEVPLTHRVHSSAIALVTGHEHPGKPQSKLDWDALARFPGTLVIYMGFSRLSLIVTELIRCGKSPDTPAIAVTRASCGEQRSVAAPLTELDDSVRAAGLETPALVLIGPVVGLKPERSWFEQRPLLGRRVLVTRPPHQADDLVRRLDVLGAIPLLLPAIEVQPPSDWATVDGVQDALAQHDWLVFTSANGVEFFFGRLFERGLDARSFGSLRIATVGSATAKSLQRYFLKADLVANGAMNSEALFAELSAQVAGKRVVLAQAAGGREWLRQQLERVASVTAVTVYQQAEAVAPDQTILDHLRRGEVDWVTLTSPNIARAFLAVCDSIVRERLARGEIRVASNSPRTTAVMKEAGVAIVMESKDPTMESLVEAIATA